MSYRDDKREEEKSAVVTNRPSAQRVTEPGASRVKTLNRGLRRKSEDEETRVVAMRDLRGLGKNRAHSVAQRKQSNAQVTRNSHSGMRSLRGLHKNRSTRADDQSTLPQSLTSGDVVLRGLRKNRHALSGDSVELDQSGDFDELSQIVVDPESLVSDPPVVVPSSRNHAGHSVETTDLQDDTNHELQSTEGAAMSTIEHANMVEAREVHEEDLESIEIAENFEVVSPGEKLRRATQYLAIRFFCFGVILLAGVLVLLFWLGILPIEAPQEIVQLSTNVPSSAPSGWPTQAPSAFVIDMPTASQEAITVHENRAYVEAYQWLLADPKLQEYPMVKRQQRFALALLFLSTGGPTQWGKSEHWMSYTMDECEWQTSWIPTLNSTGEYPGSMAYVCNNDLQYESLVLVENTLKGSIPGELFLFLPKLKVFDLAGNLISGSIPTEIGQASLLRDIVMDHNDLTGTIPTEVGLLSDLFIIMLHSNRYLSGNLPSELGNCKNLEFIVNHGHTLTGSIPTEIGGLVLLRSLEISHNYLMNGPLPDTISNLSNLVRLETQGLRLSGTLPRGISQCTNLKKLDLASSKFTGTFPIKVTQLSKLEELSLTGSTLTGRLPTEIGRLTAMKRLQINRMKLTGAVPTELGLLTQLSFLDIGGGDFVGAIPSEIGNLSLLERAYFDSDSLSGTIPSSLCSIGELRFTCTDVLCGCDCTCN